MQNLENYYIYFFFLDETRNSELDEYADHDTSDEEDIRNTVGNIPMNWYDEYKHLGKVLYFYNCYIHLFLINVNFVHKITIT